jgi:uncharacterized membrane protein YfcA
MRSGDEPGHARSALGLRLGLAAFGLVTALVGAAVVHSVAPTEIVVLFLVVALVAAVDLVVVSRHIRHGAHFQPGPEVPPYRPVETAYRGPGRPGSPEPSSGGRPRPEKPPLTERTRMRRYLILMITCLVLIVLAWFWVRFYSRPLAVAMSMVAAVLPPIAVIVANFGVRLPDESPPPPGRPPAPRQGESSAK